MIMGFFYHPYDIGVKGHGQIYTQKKTIEGYLNSVPSLTFNTIKTNLIMHVHYAFVIPDICNQNECLI